jgi:hypothetical protein
MSAGLVEEDFYRLRNIKMKKLVTLMLSISAFGLILITQPVRAEMTTLTDKQMEKKYLLSIWSLCLTVDPEAEDNDSFDDVENDKLHTYLRENFTLESEETEHISHKWQRVNAVDVIFMFDDAEVDILSRDLDIHRRR